MTARRDQRRRHVVVAGGVAAVLVAVGALLVRFGAPDVTSTDHRPEQVSVEETPLDAPSTATGDEAEPPATPAPDEPGAVAAAVRYTAASQRWLYLTDDEIAAEVAEIATPGAARSLSAETVEEIRIAREELASSAGRVWWLVHPLAWRVESYSEDSASVAVWTVTLLSAAGVALPQTEWMTVTVDLAWADGDWLVDGVRDRPGPTPMTGPQDEPWEAQPFDDALEGFTRIDGEPVA